MSLLEAKGLSKQFGGVSALKDVEVHMNPGETLGMIGPNGSGKTTFVNLVTGQLRADAGSLTFDSHDIRRRHSHELARLGLTRTYQAVRIFAGLTVQKNVDTACLLLAEHGLSAAELGELARRGADLARENAGPQGPPASLLDQDVLTVSAAHDSVAVPMRCVMALVAMGFMTDTPEDVVRVRVMPSWLRVDARFGSVFRRRGDPTLVLG